MWTPDYFVRTAELPRTVNGVTLPNDDGTFDTKMLPLDDIEHKSFFETGR